MNETKTIAVFGATGKVGSEFVERALNAGYRIRALVRNEAKLGRGGNPKVEAIVGDATHAADVAKAIAGADIVASLLGNPPDRRAQRIMSEATNAIMTAAAAQPTPPRCLMISSIGVGGSSWMIKGMLTLIGGRAGFADYERAEARVRAETTASFVVIRPYALTDKPGTGRYRVLEGQTAHFAKSIPRADVARFFFDCLENTQWDGACVNIGGA